MSRRDAASNASTGLVFATIVLVAAIFAPCLEGEFLHWDDDTTIVANRSIQRFDAGLLRWSVGDIAYTARWRPLSWLTFASIIAVGGVTPRPFHLAALVLHSACVGLLFALLRRLLRKPDEPHDERTTLAAAVGALAWGLHPMRVEAVAWASSLPYPLTLFFLLGSFHLYLQGTIRGRLAALACFAGALASYPVAVGAVVAFPAYEWATGALRIGRGGVSGRHREALLRVAPFLGAAILAGGMTLFGRLLAPNAWGAAATLEQVSFATRAARSLVAAGWYLWRPIVPIDLGPVYVVLRNVDAASVSANLLLLALVAGGTLWVRRRLRALPLLVGAYFAILAPTFGHFERSASPQDRYTYVASIFGAIVLSALVAEALRVVQQPTRRALLAAAIVTSLIGYAAMSRAQIAAWRSSEALFSHAIRVLGDDPYRADFLLRLAILYRDKGDPRRALDAVERCVAVRARARQPPQRRALTLYTQIANDFAALGLGQEAAAARTRLRALSASVQPR